MAEKTHFVTCRYAAASGKYLKEYLFTVEPYHLRERSASGSLYLGDLAVANTFSFDRNDVACDLTYISIDLMHGSSLLLPRAPK
jgi:hypothetical protein